MKKIALFGLHSYDFLAGGTGSGHVVKPAIELKGFAKTDLLQPWQSEKLVVKISDYDLASFHEDCQSWIADAGSYMVKFGASATDMRTSAKYQLKHSKKWKVHDVLRPNRKLDD